METVADRGRELLRLQAGKSNGDSMEEWCQKLLDGHGEASSIAIARDILQRYIDADDTERTQFFELLYSQFGPSASQINRTAQRYFETEQDDDLLELIQAVEPPRQELFRQLNMAPYGTRTLVDMRSDLIRFARARPHLQIVDADLKHLFSSWFNRGFLRLERIEWTSPAHILEKLIAYESVHEIKGWNDLRRRLAEDRRCFAFFHPALQDEPLIFLQVALMNGIATTISPLLDQDADIADAQQADTAIFYSINNSQQGLRGISFGNFLIKQVLTELQQEFPSLNTFTTLSPIPRFGGVLRNMATGGSQVGFDSDLVRTMLGGFADVLRDPSGLDDVIEALLAAMDDERNNLREELRDALRLIVLAYLTRARRVDGSLHDPVAEFHLANGAALERINTFADVSERGLRQSFGCMVNYRYDPDMVVANHERFVNAGTIAMSKSMARDCQRIESMLDEAA